MSANPASPRDSPQYMHFAGAAYRGARRTSELNIEYPLLVPTEIHVAS